MRHPTRQRRLHSRFRKPRPRPFTHPRGRNPLRSVERSRMRSRMRDDTNILSVINLILSYRRKLENYRNSWAPPSPDP